MTPAKIAYRPAKGARLKRCAAQKYGERLHELAGRAGSLTPSAVREDAERPDSPLHDYFTWDDTEAAEKWRIEEAKYLLRSIEVVYLDRDGNTTSVRAFHSLPVERDEDTEEDAPSRVFLTVETVMKDEATRQALIADIKRRIKGLREDMEAIGGLSEAVRLLRAAEDTLAA